MHLVKLKLTKHSALTRSDTIEHLKFAPISLVKILLKIYTYCIEHAYFPAHFKTCHVVLIPKPDKDPKLITSYRPITLAPVLSKLLEKLINDRLLNFALANNIIQPHQTAFLPRRGTENNILRLVQGVANNFNKNRYTLILSTDLKQAFDRAWHAGLLATLSSYVPHNFLILIKAFLSNRKLHFKIDNTVSDWHLTPNRGVPQGSPLSPLLFNIIMSSAPQINTKTIGTYNYADDTFFTSTAITPGLAWSQLQPHINNFIKWCEKNRLLIQPDKTTVLYLTRRRATPRHPFPNIKIQENDIIKSQTMKILGLTLDTRLCFRTHINNITVSSNSTINAIRKLMSTNRSIPPYVALLLYKSLIRSKIIYAAPALNLIKQATWKPILSLEHRALRAAYRTGIRTRLSRLYGFSKLKPIQEYYKDISKSVITRLINNKTLNILNIMFRTKPQLKRAFTHPPLDKAFDDIPIVERERLAKLIEAVLNKNKNPNHGT